jgi:hypothetical protein
VSLQKIQHELRAPKGQYNQFGKFHYRSQEDILEALKPVLNKYGYCLVITDSVELVGNWHYIKATATLYDKDMQPVAQNSAFAREPESRKGMDESQVTGSTSSYARKYALNGLFAIDDTEDSDIPDSNAMITDAQVEAIDKLMIEVKGNVDAFCKYFKVASVFDLPARDYDRAIAMLEAKRGKNA